MGLIVLQAICAAYVLVDVVQLPYLWKGLLKFKPFTCKTCMAGWLSVPLLLYYGYHHPIEILYGMCLCMVGSVVFNLLIEKL